LDTWGQCPTKSLEALSRTSIVFVTPEGFTTMVANEGLEKTRAYLKQVLQDQQLNVPSEGREGTHNPSPQFLGQD